MGLYPWLSCSLTNMCAIQTSNSYCFMQSSFIFTYGDERLGNFAFKLNQGAHVFVWNLSNGAQRCYSKLFWLGGVEILALCTTEQNVSSANLCFKSEFTNNKQSKSKNQYMYRYITNQRHIHQIKNFNKQDVLLCKSCFFSPFFNKLFNKHAFHI